MNHFLCKNLHIELGTLTVAGYSMDVVLFSLWDGAKLQHVKVLEGVNKVYLDYRVGQVHKLSKFLDVMKDNIF